MDISPSRTHIYRKSTTFRDSGDKEPAENYKFIRSNRDLRDALGDARTKRRTKLQERASEREKERERERERRRGIGAKIVGEMKERNPEEK